MAERRSRFGTRWSNTNRKGGSAEEFHAAKSILNPGRKAAGPPGSVWNRGEVIVGWCRIGVVVRGLPEQALKRGSHTSIPQLRAAILEYVGAHNENGKPFKWTKTADEILEKMRRFGLRTQQVHGE
jgi:hypothetical protein